MCPAKIVNETGSVILHTKLFNGQQSKFWLVIQGLPPSRPRIIHL